MQYALLKNKEAKISIKLYKINYIDIYVYLKVYYKSFYIMYVKIITLRTRGQ